MRGITGTLVVLLAVGYFASSAEWSASRSTGTGTVLMPDGWRRTAQGWEQVADWRMPVSPPREPFACRIRPWTIAALQLLVSLLALLLTCPADRKMQGVKPRHADAAIPDSRHRVTA